MMAGRVTRVVALGSAAVALAGGVLVGAVGTASAEPNPGHHQQHCPVVKGQWVRTWHRASHDRRGREHAGYWTRTFVPAHEVCSR